MIPPQYFESWRKAIRDSYPNCRSFYFKRTDFFFPFFLVESNSFGNRVISLPFIDFGGPIGKSNAQFFSESIQDIKDNQKEFDLKHIEIRLNTFMPNYKEIEKVLLKEGFSKELKRHQFILKLKDEEKLWNSFNRITRKGIRKSLKTPNLKTKKINNEQELKEFYKMYLKNMRDFGTPQHSYKYFKNLQDMGKENFMGFNCYKDDTLMASLIVLYSKDYMYTAYNFSKSEYLKYQPNDLLYWEMIKFAISKGIKYFDFGQCEINAEKGTHAYGIYKFKSKWNGKLYERPYFYYKFKKDIKQLNKKGGRKMWKRLPIFITKILGPKISSELAL